MKKLKLNTVFSQRDNRWGNILLGLNTDPKFNIYNYGCKLSSFATYVKALGKDETPSSLNEKFKATNSFVNYGELPDDRLTRVFGDINIKYSSDKYEAEVPEAVLNKAKDLLNQGYLIFAEIDFNPTTIQEEMHFINIYGYDNNGQFLITDPWTGSKANLDIYGETSRVLYRILCYDKKLEFEEDLFCEPISTHDWLINGATIRKEVAEYLEIGDPDHAQTDSFKAVVGGIKSRITDLQSQLTPLQSELENRIQQVGRLKDQLLKEEKLRGDLTKKLNDTIDSIPGIQRVYEDRTTVMQGQIDNMGKDKGKLNDELKKCQVNNDINNLTIADVFIILFDKLKKVKLK